MFLRISYYISINPFSSIIASKSITDFKATTVSGLNVTGNPVLYS